MPGTMIATALDVILGFVIVEGIALSLYHRATGKGVAPGDLVANLAAGFFLMLAARVAWAAASPPAPLAACLALALVAHVVDLGRRWQR